MFSIQKNEGVADRLLDADTLLKAAPSYYGPRFEAIKELRDNDDGTLHKGNEFRRVASLVNVPMTSAVKLLDPEWMKDKAKFYAWLDRNKRYCTYQRPSRSGRAAQVARDVGHIGKESQKLSDLGVAYEGGPETAEGWEAVEVETVPEDKTNDPT